MNREASTDYQAVNRVGRIVKTFSDIEIGRAWVRENSSFYGRLELLEVETVVTTRRVYRPRPKPVQSLASPPRQDARLCA